MQKNVGGLNRKGISKLFKCLDRRASQIVFKPVHEMPGNTSGKGKLFLA